MPLSRSKIREYVKSLARCRTPDAVLITLQSYSRPYHGVDVIGAWGTPVPAWRPGENLFYHPDVSKQYARDYLEGFERNGFSALSLKAWVSSVPFTHAEAENGKDARHKHNVNWIFPVFQKHGFRDGLYCPFRTWGVGFSSVSLLALAPYNRVALSAAGQAAIWRIETLQQTTRRRPNHSDMLTTRELQILQQRVFMGNAAIARHLGISIETVDTHLKNIRAKLKADDTAMALIEALRRGLIKI